jgi:methionyl-tRNA formyltransferase
LGKIGTQELGLACGDFWLKIIELQPEGKRKMSGAEYLAGHPLPHYTG